MSEILKFFLVQISLIAVVLILHTYIGLHIIRRMLIFSDLVLDQLAAFGALIGIGIGIKYGTVNSYFISLIAVLFGSFLLTMIAPKRNIIPREAVIGIMYALSLVACLLLGDKLSGGGTYVTKTLSGSMLWVNWPLVIVTLSVYIILLIFHFQFREKFIGLTENTDNISRVRIWEFLFFASQGIITVLIVPIAGVLLAYAFLMIPAAIALLFTRNWVLGVLLGWTVGFLSCLGGLSASYFFNFPYGPSLVLAMGIAFIISLIIKGVRNKS
ncbi:MAG: metal ABC transporter permease [Candidatus Aureabacteria bacterium]|nr:metal ABC transporter permease [Candidatus Auribacterota bacterium]